MTGVWGTGSLVYEESSIRRQNQPGIQRPEARLVDSREGGQGKEPHRNTTGWLGRVLAEGPSSEQVRSRTDVSTLVVLRAPGEGNSTSILCQQ